MKRRSPLIGFVVAFLLIDAVLLTLAFGGARMPAFLGATHAEQPTARTSAAPSAEPTEPTASEPTANSTATVATPTRFISAFDNTTAWRATTAACPVAAPSESGGTVSAAPELTTDSGATWKTTDATVSAKITSIQSLLATGKAALEVIGLSPTGCTPAFAKTFVAGGNYALYPDQLGKKWYVDPADRSHIHTPTGVVTAPCASVVSLATTNSTAAVVLCADQQIWLTTDTAHRWSPAATVPGVVNVALNGTGYFAAAVGRTGCDGISIMTSAGGAMPSETGCFQIDTAAPDLTGSIAISSAAGALWLWAGDQLARSTDSGRTWH